MTLSSKIWEYSFLGREDGREILHGLHVKDTGESPCPSHILTPYTLQHLQNLERWVRIEIGGVGAVPDLSSVGNISK